MNEYINICISVVMSRVRLIPRTDSALLTSQDFS